MKAEAEKNRAARKAQGDADHSRNGRGPAPADLAGVASQAQRETALPVALDELRERGSQDPGRRSGDVPLGPLGQGHGGAAEHRQDGRGTPSGPQETGGTAHEGGPSGPAAKLARRGSRTKDQLFHSGTRSPRARPRMAQNGETSLRTTVSRTLHLYRYLSIPPQDRKRVHLVRECVKCGMSLRQWPETRPLHLPALPILGRGCRPRSLSARLRASERVAPNSALDSPVIVT